MRRILLACATAFAMLSSLVVLLTLNGGEPDRALALQRCAEISDRMSRQECLSAVITSALDDRSYSSLATELGALSESVAAFRGDCHAATHRLGNAALAAYSDTDDLIADTSPRVCGDGMAHSVMESFAVNGAESVPDWLEIVQACARYIDREEGLGDGCAHGFGHGTYLAVGPEGGVPAALALCRQVLLVAHDTTLSSATSTTMDTGCSYGVMMSAYAPAGTDMEPLTQRSTILLDCEQLLGRAAREETPAYIGCMAGGGFALGADLAVNALPPSGAAMDAVRLCLGSSSYPASRAAVSCADQVLQAAGELILERAHSTPVPERLVRYHDFCRQLGQSYGEQMRGACLVQPRNTVTDSMLVSLHAHDPSLTALIESTRVDFGS
jgi:hypothetical protein